MLQPTPPEGFTGTPEGIFGTAAPLVTQAESQPLERSSLNLSIPSFSGLVADIFKKGDTIALFPAAVEIDDQFFQKASAILERNSIVREYYEFAAGHSKFSIDQLMLKTPADREHPVIRNLAVFLYEVSLYRQIENALGGPLQPKCFAGYSIGIFPCLCLSGAVSFESAFKMLTNGLEVIKEEVESGRYHLGHLRILGIGAAPLKEYLAANPEVRLTNDMPRVACLTLLKGSEERLEDFEAKLNGVKRDISEIYKSCGEDPHIKCVHNGSMNKGPHHGFYDAFVIRQRQLALGLLEEAKNKDSFIRDPKVPILSCSRPGKILRTKEDIRIEMLDDLNKPVFWSDLLQTIQDLGLRFAVEIGPGRMLTNCSYQFAPKIIPLSILDSNDLDLGRSAFNQIADLKEEKKIKIIGITGPTSCGKSTAAKYLAELGYNTISVGDYYRAAFPNFILNELGEKIDPQVINKQGGISSQFFLRDSSALEHAIEIQRKIVPYLAFRTMTQVFTLLLTSDKDIYIESPILNLLGLGSFLDQVWTIERPEAERQASVVSGLERETLKGPEAAKVLSMTDQMQLSLPEFRVYGDHILVNNNDLGAFKQQIENLIPKAT